LARPTRRHVIAAYSTIHGAALAPPGAANSLQQFLQVQQLSMKIKIVFSAAAIASCTHVCATTTGLSGPAATCQLLSPAEVLKDLGGAEIVKLTPCHITPYLAGRTLWLIG